MADPYGVNPHHLLESDDMTSFVHNFLRSSPASAGGVGLFGRPATEVSVMEGSMRGGSSAPLVVPSSSLNLSNHFGFYGAEIKEDAVNAFPSAGIGDCEGIINSSRGIEFGGDDKVDDDFTFVIEDCETSDAPSNHAQRRSSKRSRSAEVHNMSEKRRRSRINEKLKALQTLIPNSNKTDKASMLDEAIEYLKQLQLQVQMLTMRNGLSLYPSGYNFQVSPVQVPPSGTRFEESEIPNFSGIHEISFHKGFEISHQNMRNNPTPLLLDETPLQNHYGVLNHFASTKDLCRNDAISRLHLQMSSSGNNSSPGVSSS